MTDPFLLQAQREILHDLIQGAAERQPKEVQGRVGAKISQIHTLQQETTELLHEWKHAPENPRGSQPKSAEVNKQRHVRNLQECLADAERQSYQLRGLILPRLL